MPLHLSLARYIAYLLISGLAVYVSGLDLHVEDNALLIGCISWECGVLISITNHFLRPLILPASFLYCIPMALLLVALRPATTLLGRYAVPYPRFAENQHMAVHLALAFYVLSETKFYRAYAAFRPGDLFLLANVDREFPMARETYFYVSLDEYFAIWQRYVRDAPADTTCLDILFSARFNVFCGLFVVAYIVAGWCNWLIMGILDAREEQLWVTVMRHNGFFRYEGGVDCRARDYDVWKDG
jgi:hypothetical protein